MPSYLAKGEADLSRFYFLGSRGLRLRTLEARGFQLFAEASFRDNPLPLSLMMTGDVRQVILFSQHHSMLESTDSSPFLISQRTRQTVQQFLPSMNKPPSLRS